MVNRSQDSQVKIADFGLSIILGPGETVYESIGTMNYAAPEMLSG